MSHKTDTLNNSLTLIFVLIFLVPVVFVFLNIFSDSSEVWTHIQTYLLKDYVVNSLIIVIFVAAFTVIIGTSLAWIVSMYEFPGVNIFKWLLILPMARPTYVNG